MLISQKANDYDCAILKTEVASWLTSDRNTRWEWQKNLLTSEEAFIEAKRILIPWNKNGNHWTLFHLDSTRKTIESFDSFHFEPNEKDLEYLSDFITVCLFYLLL